MYEIQQLIYSPIHFALTCLLYMKHTIILITVWQSDVNQKDESPAIPMTSCRIQTDDLASN